ncbi:MAG TPA: DUF3638 domain-containing protein, partial [Rhabdochlamydiaceae bacterium]|nr:DUF3638 domain-containing protein [Rhabdochlamydiaceae bacterium]
IALYGLYTDQIKDHSTNQRLNEAHLLLTPLEDLEYQTFRKESFSVLLAITPTVTTARPVTGQITLPRPLPEHYPQEFMRHLILYMQPVRPNVTLAMLQQEGMAPSADSVLKNFWTYWTMIIEDKLTIDDLAPFFLPIPAGQDLALTEAIDYGRRLLLTFSCLKNHDKKLLKDFEKLKLMPPADLFTKKETILGTGWLDFGIRQFEFINYIKALKMLRQTEALTAMQKTLSSIFKSMLQAAKESVAEGEPLQLRPAAAAPVKAERLPTKSLEDFEKSLNAQEAIAHDKRSLSQEEITLYKTAVEKIKEASLAEMAQPRTSLQLLEKLMSQGVPAVEMRRQVEMRRHITELETPSLALPEFSAQAVSIAAKTPFATDEIFFTDARIARDLDDLTNHLNTNPKKAKEWYRKYQAILNARVSTALALQITHPPHLRTNSQYADFLLYCAAEARKAEIIKAATTALPDVAIVATVTRGGLLASDTYTILKPGLDKIYQVYNTHTVGTELEVLQTAHNTAIAAFPNNEADSALTKAENQRLRDGLDEAHAKRKAIVEFRGKVVPANALPLLKGSLDERIAQCSTKIESLQTEIIDIARQNAGLLQLSAMFRHLKRPTRQDVMNALLDLYQDGKIKGLEAAVAQKLETKLTQYLLIATEREQLQQARRDYFPRLESLAAKRQQLSQQDPNVKTITELDIEWKVVSREIYDRIERGSNKKDRYTLEVYAPIITAIINKRLNLIKAEFDIIAVELGQVENYLAGNPADPALLAQKAALGKRQTALTERRTALQKDVIPTVNEADKTQMADQTNTRKYLVFEYRNQLILRPEQLEKIKAMLDDPNALEELRMGLGKSSVIFPLVARLLAQKGYFPIVIFTEELLEQSRKEMEKTAYVFEFRRSSPVDPVRLAEEYETLLTVKRSGRFVMTTVERIAALENKIVELYDQLNKSWKMFSDNKEALNKAKAEGKPDDEKKIQQTLDELLKQMKTIESQLYWLQKMNALFDDPMTRFVADEVDDIYNISSEKNYSDGKQVNVNHVAFDAGEKLFSLVFNSADPALTPFKEAILNDTLANFSPEQVKDFMSSLAVALYDDATFWTDKGWDRSHCAKEEFAAYMSNPDASARPVTLPEWEDDDQKRQRFVTMIGACRYWMTKTIPTLCKKQAGKDYNFTSDGFTVVPLKEQREKPNTKFGEEAELIGYHMLVYLRHLPKIDFFESQLQEPKLQSLLTKLGHTKDTPVSETYTALEAPKHWLYRLQFLRFLMQESSRIQVYERQMTRNVQDTMRGRLVAGASGTMNPYALPTQFSYDRSADKRGVTAETILRLAQMGKGMSEEVGEFTDLLGQMKTLTKDHNCKAIINQGYAFQDRDTLQVIKDLRTADQRIFIFIHPTEKKAYIWHPGQAAPRQFDKLRDTKELDSKRVLYYFGPADTRGTDFKIPSGYGALITGPTTTLDQMDQAICRLRDLGQGQEAKLFIAKPVAGRIRGNREGHKPTVQDVLNDIKKQSIEANSMQNFKAASKRPEDILRMHVKKALFTPTTEDLSKADDATLLLHYQQDAEIFGAVEELFIRSKALEFKDAYMPSHEEDIIKFLQDKHAAATRRIEAIRGRLSAKEQPITRAKDFDPDTGSALTTP